MFDIGWSELVVIGVVALIVIGPKELPGVLRTVGQWTTRLKRMANEFQGQFQEAMREAEIAEMHKQFQDTTRDLADSARIDNPLGTIANPLGMATPEPPAAPMAEALGAAAQAEPAVAPPPAEPPLVETPPIESSPVEAAPDAPPMPDRAPGNRAGNGT